MSFKDKFTKERMARFFDREGFYIILFICVCVVAITAVWVSRTGGSSNKNIGGSKGNKETVQTPNKETVNPGSGGNTKTPVAENTETGNTGKTGTSTGTPSKSTSSTSTNKGSVASIKFDNPIKSTLTEKSVVLPYSPDNQVEFTFTKDWRTHKGIDIESKIGSEVLAAYGGKVIDVMDDNEYADGLGWTVVIDHGNGYRTVYSNLDGKASVKKGDTVKKGQKIGTVGNSSICEKSVSQDPVESHLHYEVLKKGVKSYENVDPTKFLTFES